MTTEISLFSLTKIFRWSHLFLTSLKFTKAASLFAACSVNFAMSHWHTLLQFSPTFLTNSHTRNDSVTLLPLQSSCDWVPSTNRSPVISLNRNSIIPHKKNSKQNRQFIWNIPLEIEYCHKQCNWLFSYFSDMLLVIWLLNYIDLAI